MTKTRLRDQQAAKMRRNHGCMNRESSLQRIDAEPANVVTKISKRAAKMRRSSCRLQRGARDFSAAV